MDKLEEKFVFKTPCIITVAAPTQGGKTFWTLRLLQHRDRLFEPPVKNVIWCYGAWQEALRNIPATLHEGLPTSLDFPPDSLVILDDLMEELERSPEAIALFTRKAHHQRLTIIFLTQNLFFSNRTLRTSTHYYILMRSLADTLQISNLARQLFANKWRFMLEAYEDAIKERYGFLVVSTHPATNEQLRVCAKIFDKQVVVYLAK
jgi:hypothetical protein